MSTAPSGGSRPTTHRIEIEQRHLDDAQPDEMGRQAIIDALRDAGMTETWIKGNMCAMTHADGQRRYYSLSTRLDGWQLERMRNPRGGAAPSPCCWTTRPTLAGWRENP